MSGTAGFIGAAVAYRLLERGDHFIGIDNHNTYYDPNLKEVRVLRLSTFSSYTHTRINVADQTAMATLFKQHSFQHVIHY
ncbi:NAD-dependent epimerase/dehydratase family protein [Halomonas sp. ZH2S]|uniref:NAD-dependent epimerase/dehydratase family protein n=1 Tax=Vreelandella zhuhanensis TaxID=2684210 RepID=A0A7X3GYY0_9GAMM|nr:NAD-dependent epimerase/dehydratase family protein [Halomonas zhuhanensis]